MQAFLKRLGRSALTAPGGETRVLLRSIVVFLLLTWLLQSLGSALQLSADLGQGYAPTALRFEVTWQPQERQDILDFWRASGGMLFIANAALLVDLVLYIPAYLWMLLVLESSLQRKNAAVQARNDWVARDFRRLGVAVVVLASFSAALDGVENLISLVLLNAAGPIGTSWHMTLAAVANAKWIGLSCCGLSLMAMEVCLFWSMGWTRMGRAAHGWALFAVNAVQFGFLHVFPLIALVGGIAMTGFVPQGQEILTSLGLEPGDSRAANLMRYSNLWWLAFGVMMWAFSIWYSMRIVERWTPGRESMDDKDFTGLATEAPRLFAYFGVVTVATLSALSMSARASLAMAAFMCLGAVIMRQAGFSLLVWVGKNLGIFLEDYQPVSTKYRNAALAVSVLAFLVAWVAVGADQAAVPDWFGWYLLPPNQVWRWDASKISLQTVWLIALFSAAALAHMLVVRFRAWPLAHVFLNLVAVTCWWIGATLADANLAVVVFGIVMAIGVLGLWFVAERQHFNWVFIRQIYELVLKQQSTIQRLMLKRPRVFIWALLLIASAATVLMFSVAPLQWGWSMGTLGIFFAALALWSFVCTLCWVYWPKSAGLGNWSLVPVVWLLFFGQQADHSIRSGPVNRQALPAIPTIHEHFKSWRAGLPDPETSPVFFVAASGGGLRAAYWTASLLAAMDDRTCGQFGGHVFAISGVSGGSLGVAAYLAQRKIWAQALAAEPCRTGRVEEIPRFLRRDFLGPVAGSLLFAEAVQGFVPFTYLEQERGRTLADSISQGWKHTFAGESGDLLDKPFFDMFGAGGPDEAKHLRLPAVYLNATGVESGRRVVASNLQLGAILADPLFYAGGVSRATQMQTAGISVVDAVVNSARFPGVSPPGRISACAPGLARSKQSDDLCSGIGHGTWGHVVDGGFFENSGLETAMDALRELRGNGSAAARKGLPPIFVISISNDRNPNSECHSRGTLTPRFDLIGNGKHGTGSVDAVNAIVRRANAQPGAAAGDKADGSDISAPLKALLSVRGGRASLEVRRAVEELGCSHVVEWNLGDVMNTANEPALGWLLSKRSVASMDSGVARYAASLPFDTAWCWQEGTRSRGLIGKGPMPDHAKCPVAEAASGPLLPGKQ